MKEAVRYFGDSEVFRSYADAVEEARRLKAGCPILEYGISTIQFPGKFPKHDEECTEMAGKREYTITIVAKTTNDALVVLDHIGKAIIDGFQSASWTSDDGGNSYSFTSREK